ncbi:hypothetical protein ACH5RR_016916 [Cinchona calisaya]|uniref:RNase H type-1 domain-containing protein n=1 Tax=Cinchona calisaya TaxID=153742 RepID=A0ABD2ZXF0_9GENT
MKTVVGEWNEFLSANQDAKNKSNSETGVPHQPNHWISPVQGCRRIITSRDSKEHNPRTVIGLIVFNECGELKLVEAEGKEGFKGALVEDAEILAKMVSIQLKIDPKTSTHGLFSKESILT